jgi:ammonium transporter, Amt family
VEIASGMGALAYSIILGPREGTGPKGTIKSHRPHSISNVMLGTVFLWFGWFGFNAGSALGANLRAAMAFLVTNLAGCTGAMTWIFMDWRLERKWSVVGVLSDVPLSNKQLCSGAIAGLVAATPSSGFINPHAGIACGVIAAALCNYATKLKFLVGIDDSMDIFAVHGLAGVIGLLINGLFGVNYVPALDGLLIGDAAIPGGWFNHHWVQLGYQVAYIGATTAYSFTVSAIILYIMNFIPWLRLRVSHEAEDEGIDEAELGEFAFDFVEVRRDFDSWNAPDPSLIEGRVREEIGKQQEQIALVNASNGINQDSSDEKIPQEEEDLPRHVSAERGGQRSNYQGDEIAVAETSESL